METIKAMGHMSYSHIAFEVLRPYLAADIPEDALAALLDDAYRKGRSRPKCSA